MPRRKGDAVGIRAAQCTSTHEFEQWFYRCSLDDHHPGKQHRAFDQRMQLPVFW